MRQTNAGIRRCNTMNVRVMLCMILLLFGSITAAMADVSNVTLTATIPGTSGIINSGGSVSLSASWQGDSPPYTAKFKKGGNTLVSEPAINGTSSNISIPASQIGDTAGTAEVLTVEIVDSGNKSASGVANKGVIVDFIPPTITAVVTNGPVFSNTQSVRIQITSNETIKAPTVSANGVAATMEGSLTTGTSFVYNLQLTAAFTNGTYNVSVSGKDMSEPEGSANTGSTSVTFTVGTTATGNTTITSSTPASPTNATTVSLTGTCPSGVATIEIQDGGTQVSTVAVTGTSWTIGISPAEGAHSYVAISKDTNGTEVSRSAAFALTIDRSAPAKPVADTSSVPSNTNQNSVTIPVNITGVDTEVAKPLTIQALVNGTPVGSAQAVTASPANVTVPLESGLNRITFRLTDAAGNTSEISDPVNVVSNSDPSSTTTIVTLESPVVMPLPVASSYQLGAGSYKLKMIFSKDMNSGTNPVINITTAGGIKITSSAGAWTASTTYIGDFSIPQNGGASYDGAATLSITGAKDAFGNTLNPISPAGGAAFYIDSTPAVATFNEETSIYISSSTPTITLSGQVSDGSSGVGYIDLIWQPFTGGTVSSQSVPIMAASPSPWNYTWNASALAAGKYKLWVAAADQAKPNPNVENYLTKSYRILIVDRDEPVVTRISLGNMAVDINSMPQPVVIASAVTRLTAVINDGGDSGIAFDNPGFVFSLVHDSTSASILGNKSNNGNDTIFFDFPELTIAGTYTVTVTPVDAGGNKGATASRSFALEKDAPSAVNFFPADQRIANATHDALSVNQVWATINHPRADYVTSTIDVRYNGSVAGRQLTNASTSGLIWQLYTGTLAKDQSHDGRYDVTVVPKTTLGNTGEAVRAFFTYDSIPPVITVANPAVNLSSSGNTPWFGTSQSELSVTVSDAPKDIVTYGPQMPADSGLAGVKVPGDPNWYNSSGSGVDTTNSSFTWTMGTTNSTPHTFTGNKLVLKAPAVPSDTSVGVADVLVSVRLLDRANDGQIIPNVLNASYTYKFDYMAPEVTSISKPDSTKNKYCKNTVTFEGLVQDKGSAAELKVTSIEWAEGSNAWTTMTASNLPAKSASFTSTLDISGKTDGTYTVKLRAIDLGNNASAEKTSTFVVDRTPPVAPTLIVPLPDFVTNKRSHSFKWSASADADQYLLQVADDPSFNNVLNTQVNTGYPGLIGQVLVMTEGAFTMPKDGTYYWRVAAIETCVDGFNISSYSTTRKFTVDTVKPLIVSVSPAPSSGNKITTGMVTFTIRFSENIDSTITPTVKLTSAGGQMMVIEKVTYKEDTWTGTTVIPKNSSAMYDGTAIISVESAADLAGNIMAADSTNSVVINTGPAFTTKIFSNPANEYELMIITKGSEALQSPPSCSVQQSSARTPVVMNFLKERFYAGSYKIDVTSPGKAYIDISGTDLHGMVGNDSVEFMVADLSASQRLNMASVSGKASLKGAENSAYTAAAIYMIDRDSLESPFTSGLKASMMPGIKASAAKNSELVGVLPLEEIGPASVRLKKRLLYTADIGSEQTIPVPENKVHVYRLDKDGNWIFQGGTLKDGKISAELTGLGRVALMADLTEPVVKALSPESMEKLETALPEIKGEIADNGAGLNKESFKLFINEVEIPDAVVDDSGNFSYKVNRALPKGKHEVRFEVADQAGNTLKKSFWVTAPGAFALDEFMPYPNPATGNAMYFNYNFNQNAERVRLKVYDTAGHVVADFDTYDFANQKDGRVRWDLRSNNGKRVANGVYFYQLQVTRGGETLKRRGKFAVMR